MADSNLFVEKGEHDLTLTTQDDPVTVVLKCTHKDNAVEIAKYMVEEIKKNCITKAVKVIKEGNSFFSGTSKSTSYLLWAQMVKPNAPWDHKPDLAEKFEEMSGTTSLHHKYKTYEYYYDIWSNIHYGYVGMFCGFTGFELLEGAGAAQVWTDYHSKTKKVTAHTKNGVFQRFDDVTDSISIQIGIDLYEANPAPAELTEQKMLDLIEAAEYPIQKYSKIAHPCYSSGE